MERPPGTVTQGDLALDVLKEVDALVGASARACRYGDPGNVIGVGGDGHVRLEGIRLTDELGCYSVMSLNLQGSPDKMTPLMIEKSVILTHSHIIQILSFAYSLIHDKVM